MQLQGGRAHEKQLGELAELGGYGATQRVVIQQPAKYPNQHNGLVRPSSPATIAHTAQPTSHVNVALVLTRAEYKCLYRRIT